MNKFLTLFFSVFFLVSCEKSTDCCTNLAPVKITLKFSHNWDGIPVTSADFNNFKFTTENGEKLSIERLRYIVSKISVGNSIKNYKLINLGQNSGLEIVFNNIAQGNTFIKFTFGFSDSENIDGVYQDLNSINFGVPMMLGGGYHYMQFDGKYKDINNQDANFNYHAIRAVNRSDPNNLNFQDTSFEVDLTTLNLTKDTVVEIKMNIAEWFKNPNTWDLNQLNTVLMPNFNAQILMNENGKSVFSLGTVTQ